MAKITITVSGVCGSGKTTIAQQIFYEMSKLGYDVSIEDPDFIVARNLKKRLEALKNANLEVKIITKQEQRK